MSGEPRELALPEWVEAFDDEDASREARAGEVRATAAAAADSVRALSDAFAATRSAVEEQWFIVRAATLPPNEFAELHEVLKTAKVPLRPFNAAVAKHRRKAKEAEARRQAEARVATETRAKPRIRLGHDEHRVVDEGIAAFAQHDDAYQRAGSLVRVVRDLSPTTDVARRKGSPFISPLPAPSLREMLSEVAVWTVEGQFGPRAVSVPQKIVNEVHARGSWRDVRALEGVVECPMLRPDGTVIQTEGFDPLTGVLYLPSREFVPVPEYPTEVEVRSALAAIYDVVSDFPFKEPCHRAAWLAALLTPLARFAFEGPSPLNLVDGNTAGAGKGKAVAVIGIIATGEPLPTMTPTDDDAEQRKRITSIALAGEMLALIDNVAGSMGSPSLDAALTSTFWTDRLLGVNQTVRIPLKLTWYATGNNVQCRGDLQRRVLHIRLQTPLDRPEERENFRYPHLETYVRESRPQLLAAALTILRGYCAAGRPRGRLPSWGSFEGWSALVREAIVWLGEPDPAAARVEHRSENDVFGQAVVGLVDGWRQVTKRFGGACTAAQALKELSRNEREADRPSSGEKLQYEDLREALSVLATTPDGRLPSPHSVGLVLRRYRAKAVICGDGVTCALMTPKSDGKNANAWTVREVDERPRGGRDAADLRGAHLPTVSAGDAGDRRDPSTPDECADPAFVDASLSTNDLAGPAASLGTPSSPLSDDETEDPIPPWDVLNL